ncbi:MAG: hypothetical protein ACOY3I_09215 [Verrucomicrobiota bacterium]
MSQVGTATATAQGVLSGFTPPDRNDGPKSRSPLPVVRRRAEAPNLSSPTQSAASTETQKVLQYIAQSPKRPSTSVRMPVPQVKLPLAQIKLPKSLSAFPKFTSSKTPSQGGRSGR